MNHANPDQLRKMTRRAYEVGRMRTAARALWIVVPLVVISLWAGNNVITCLALGASLALGAVLLLWYGREFARGTKSGLLAGIAPMSLPLATHASGFCAMGMSCQTMCMVACVAGGLGAGVVVGYRAVHHRGHMLREILVAGTLAAVVGALGCSMIGISGLLGMAGAIAVASLTTTALLKPNAQPT